MVVGRKSKGDGFQVGLGFQRPPYKGKTYPIQFDFRIKAIASAHCVLQSCLTCARGEAAKLAHLTESESLK